MHGISRRACLIGSSGVLASLGLTSRVLAAGFQPGAGGSTTQTPALDDFPSQDRAVVRDMVGASHARIERVAELLKEMPRLANAAWDWGFGDWETALGAASHVGNREIAAMLLEHGARPDLFTHAMLGNVDVVRATIETSPGIERVRGPHGLTLAHHARAGGEGSAAVAAYLATLEGADLPYVNAELGELERAVYLGNYRFGTADDEVIEILYQEKWKCLSITRVGRGGSGIRLTHLGEHAFHPTGAPEVRIAFAVGSAGSPASGVTITAPMPVVSATRV